MTKKHLGRRRDHLSVAADTPNRDKRGAKPKDLPAAAGPAGQPIKKSSEGLPAPRFP